MFVPAGGQGKGYDCAHYMKKRSKRTEEISIRGLESISVPRKHTDSRVMRLLKFHARAASAQAGMVI